MAGLVARARAAVAVCAALAVGSFLAVHGETTAAQFQEWVKLAAEGNADAQVRWAQCGKACVRAPHPHTTHTHARTPREALARADHLARGMSCVRLGGWTNSGRVSAAPRTQHRALQPIERLLAILGALSSARVDLGA